MSYVLSALGALERRNPLPAGRYSYTAIPEGSGLTNPTQPVFNAWLDANRSTVKVLAVSASGEGSERQDHVVFDVKSPTPWDAVRLGFPNIQDPKADPGDIVHQEGGGDGSSFWWDDVSSFLNDTGKGLPTGSGLALLAVTGFAAYYILKNLPEMMAKRKAA